MIEQLRFGNVKIEKKEFHSFKKAIDGKYW